MHPFLRSTHFRFAAPAALAVGTSLLLALLLATPARASEDGRVIVKYKAGSMLLRRPSPAQRPDADTGSATALGRRAGLALRAGRQVGERLQVVLGDGIPSAELVQRLARQSDVEYAVVDERRHISTAPNDPFYAAGPPVSGARGGPVVGQWYLRTPDATVKSSIDVETAWALSQGSPGVVVAVLDTGVRFDHADLRTVAAGGNLLAGYDFVSNDFAGADGSSGRDADASDPGDFVSQADVNSPSNTIGCSFAQIGNSSWHGTRTAGLIGALTHNGVGMAGVSRNARVLPVRVLGKCGGYDSDIVAGMLWSAGISVPGAPANNTPAKVLNMSLGGAGACSPLYQDAVNQVTARGAVIVAAAGNTTGHAASSPANCAGVIAVAGLRHVGAKVGFSDLGPEIAISAPAGNCVNVGPGDACLYPMLTATNPGTTTPLSHAAGGSIYTDSFNVSLGTSFSAPLVSGTVAMMLSVQPLLSPLEVRSVLQASARPFPTTGADNGDGTPVLQCAPPRPIGQPQIDQLQCYCNTGTCGAGMLDAGAAVRAANPIHATITPDLAPPQRVGTQITLTASASGGSSPSYEYKWWVSLDGGAHWTVLREWGAGPGAGTYVWTPATPSAASLVAIWVRNAGSSLDAAQGSATLPYATLALPPATISALVASLPSPQLRGTPIDLSATGSAGTGAYEFKWWASADAGAHWVLLRDWGAGAITWTPTSASAAWLLAAWVRGTGSGVDAAEDYEVLPYAIEAPPPATVSALAAGLPSPQLRGTPIPLLATAAGGTGAYEFKWWASPDGGAHWSVLREWGAGTFAWTTTTASADWRLAVWVRTAGAGADVAEGYQVLPYAIEAPPPATVRSLVASLPSPQLEGTPVDLAATAAGGTGAYEFKWWASPDGGAHWSVLQEWGAGMFAWTPTTASAAWRLAVWVRTAGAGTDVAEGYQVLPYAIEAPPPASVGSLVASLPSPQLRGTPIDLTATASGGTGTYAFKWWASPDGGAHWIVLRDWGAGSLGWTATTESADWRLAVWVRNARSRVDAADDYAVIPYVISAPPPVRVSAIVPSVAPPLRAGDTTSLLATASGGVAPYQFKWWLSPDGGRSWQLLRDWGAATFAWTPTQPGDRYEIGVWVRDAGSSADAPAHYLVIPYRVRPLQSPPPQDFDGDGHSDRVSYGATGEVRIDLLQAARLLASGVAWTLGDPGWEFVATPDLDADRSADLVWHQRTTGASYAWGMSGTRIKTVVALPTTPPGWKLMGSGDFDGDGQPDLLWWDAATGQLNVWLLSGMAVRQSSLLGTAPTLQAPEGCVADFDDDGRDDWFPVGSAPPAPAGASIRGCADFDGDHRADVFWNAPGGGSGTIWVMNAGQIARSATVDYGAATRDGTPSGDFDGDGQRDVLWTDATSGESGILFLSGTTVRSGATITP